MPIFSGGRTQASVHVTQAHHKWVGAQEQTYQTDILTSVSAIFLNAAELKDKQKLIIARLDILYQRLNEMDALIKEGRISAADRALILSAVETGRSDSVDIAVKWQELGLRLGQTLGMEQPVFPDINSINAALINTTEIPKLDENILLTENGYIMQAKALVERAEALHSLNKRNFLPDLSGFAVYYYRSGGTDWDPDGEWAAGVKLSIPIFDGGKRIAGLQTSNSDLRSSEQSMKATVNNETARFKIASYQWKSAQHQEENLVQAVIHKEQYVTAQKAVYKAGRIPLSELMSQEAELLQLNLREKSIVYNERRSAIEYYASAGILTEEIIFTLLRNTK
jgi:outer membrane protein TolC